MTKSAWESFKEILLSLVVHSCGGGYLYNQMVSMCFGHCSGPSELVWYVLKSPAEHISFWFKLWQFMFSVWWDQKFSPGVSIRRVITTQAHSSFKPSMAVRHVGRASSDKNNAITLYKKALLIRQCLHIFLALEIPGSNPRCWPRQLLPTRHCWE